MSLRTYLDRYLPLIERELEAALAGPALPAYYGMMQYHMGWLDERLEPSGSPQGKRFRPVLCLLACEAVGGSVERVLPAAAAIELVHNFSLIHDDIEDGSPTRRHRPTVWKLWGVAHAINSGDGMFAKAFLALGQLPERGVSFEIAHAAEQSLTATCLALTEGQYLDMTFETEMDVCLDAYMQMIRGKSATLIACSTRLGALLGGADLDTTTAYEQFGESLGMAFQVVDDILGIWGVEAKTGKSAATDILSRKKTLPIVYAFQDPDLRAMYAQETISEEDVPRVIEILERTGARTFAEQTARDYAGQAERALASTGKETPARQAIKEMMRTLLGSYLTDNAGDGGTEH